MPRRPRLGYDVRYTYEDFEEAFYDAVRVVVNSGTLWGYGWSLKGTINYVKEFIVETIKLLRSRKLRPEEVEKVAKEFERYRDIYSFYIDANKFQEYMFGGEWYAKQLLDDIDEYVPLFGKDVLIDLLGKDGFNDFKDKWFSWLLRAGDQAWQVYYVMEDVFHNLGEAIAELQKLYEDEENYSDDVLMEAQQEIAKWLESLLPRIDDAKNYASEFVGSAQQEAVNALEYLLGLIQEALRSRA